MILKSLQEISLMTEGGKILSEIIQRLIEKTKPGISTQELNKLAESLIFKYKAEPSFKGYQGFPASLCVSVNEVIVHGMPSFYILKKTDIVSLDIGIKYKGFHTDMATTVFFDKDKLKEKLIKTTKNALKKGIEESAIGKTIGDIGYVVYKYVRSSGFDVIKDLCGHGIGKDLHEEPQILNYGKRNSDLKIVEGMVFCIEPMVSVGSCYIEKTKDGYGFKTKDNSLSAHFEHTIAITKNGPKILTI